MGRSLGGVERWYWLTDRATAVNFVMAVEMEAAPSEDALRVALDRLQRRQPMLAVQLAPQGQRGLQFERCDRPLELRSLRLGAGESWLPHAEDDQLRRFELKGGPLMRCTLIDRGGAGAVLLLTFHHAAADASGAARILEQLVGYLHADTPSPSAAPAGGLPPALEEGLPAWVLSARGLLALWWRLSSMWLGWLLKGVPRQVPLESEPDLAACRDRFIRQALDEQETSALLERCKARGYTVNAALHAAQLMAVAEELPESSSAVGVLCLVDLRRRSPGAVHADMGVRTGFVTLVQRVRKGSSVAEVAAVCQRQLGRELALENEKLVLPWLGKLAAPTPLSDAGAAALELRTRRTTPALTMFSNVGKVSWDPAIRREGRVTALYFFAPLAGREVLGSGALTFDGRLHWNFTFSAPCVARERAERIAARARSILVNDRA